MNKLNRIAAGGGNESRFSVFSEGICGFRDGGSDVGILSVVFGC